MRKVPLLVVVGEPLEVDKIEEPTPEMVEHVHRCYVQRLRELFDANKAKRAGFRDSELKLV